LTQEVALALGQPLTQAGYNVAIAYLNANVLGGDHYRTGITLPQVSDFHGAGVSLNLDWTLNDNFSIRSISGYRNFHRLNRQELTGVLDTFGNQQSADDDFYSQELQLLGSFGDNIRFVAGLYYSDEEGVEESLSRNLPRLSAGRVGVFHGDVNNKSKAVFAQGNWTFLPDWTLTLGARYTEEEKGLVTTNRNILADGTVQCIVPVTLRDDGVTCSGTLNSTFSDPSWLVSLDHKLTENVLVYGKVARGFRGGGQNFRGGTVAAFAPFEPETATEYELGLKSEFFNRSLRLNVAAFYTDYADVQRNVTYQGADLNIITTFTNAATATLKGLEAEFEWRITPAFTVSASGGYLDAGYDEFVDFTGDRSNEPWPAPKFTGSLSGRYAVSTQVGELAFQATYNYQDDLNLYPQSVVGRPYVLQEAYGVLGGRITLDIDSLDAQIALYGRNLTDEEYYSAGVAVDSAGFASLFSGEPRTFGIQFSKRFGGG
ncbi:MAG: hypothetical protein JWR59_2035, partial [Brevundimonas sp.]|nr:hypothetical protein [Brevundimonas sp.]